MNAAKDFAMGYLKCEGGNKEKAIRELELTRDLYLQANNPQWRDYKAAIEYLARK